MVTDLLTSAAQRNGELVLQHSITNAASVVSESIDAALPAAQQRQVIIGVELSDP